MTERFEDMVAIASGSPIEMIRWGRRVRMRFISYIVTPNDNLPRTLELWVLKDDAERAKKAIRDSLSGAGSDGHVVLRN